MCEPWRPVGRREKGRNWAGFGGGAGGCNAAVLFGLGLGHYGPTDRLGIGEDAGWNSFVLAGDGHLWIPMGRS